MDAYNTGGDLEVNNMFDPYIYKPSNHLRDYRKPYYFDTAGRCAGDYLQRNDENLDVSLSVPQYNGHHNTHYNMGDQTFHTPSFGDEEFDIPHMHHQQQMQQHMDQYQPPPQHNMGMGGMGDPQQQQYSQWQHQESHMNAYSMQSPNQVPYHQIPSPNHNPQLQMMQPPPQQSPQMPPQMSPQIMSGVNYVGQSPPQSGHNISTEPGTTSDDSDDAIPANTLKRPSPEPAYGSESPNNSNQVGVQKSVPSAALSKKPKVQKKKKKRDPNEPQKPVSAYALFFRDTQAAIKGQNPNASFGEVSKIVASMWDVLATEHKNVYKKKTEAAKKEYLKALAAYRASLVSKGTEGEQPQQMYSPPAPAPQQQQQNAQQQSPPQISPHHHMQQQSYQQPPYAPPYKSPQAMMQMQHPHNVGHPQMNNQMSPLGQMNQMNQQPQMMSPPMNQSMNGMMGGMGGGMPSTQQQHYMNQQMPSQQQQQQQQPPPQHQMPGGHISPAQQPPPVSGSPPNHQGQGQCIRHGCNNPAIVSPDWEDEYCSNECVITHCRDVFGNWVQTNNPQQQSYSAVK